MAGIPTEAFAIGGGTLAAIVAGATLLLRSRRGRARMIAEDDAMAGAAAALAGFVPHAAVVGHDGEAALVSGTGASGDDRLALVRAGGRRLVAQAIDWGAVRATAGGIVVETGERSSGKGGGKGNGRGSGRGSGVAITGADALDVRRLAPAASAEAIRIAERLAPPTDDSAVVGRV